MKWIRWLDPDLPPDAYEPFIEPEERPVLLAARDLWRQFYDNQVAAELRPVRMDPAWTESFSTLQRVQWIEFGRRSAGQADPAGLFEGLAGGATASPSVLERGPR